MAKTVKAVVANRHSVEVDGKLYGPGETVMLPADEVSALQASGYLIDPDAAAVVGDDSPSVATVDGPTVQPG